MESRKIFDRMTALEDEGEGLRAQLERFSRRVSLSRATGETCNAVSPCM